MTKILSSLTDYRMERSDFFLVFSNQDLKYLKKDDLSYDKFNIRVKSHDMEISMRDRGYVIRTVNQLSSAFFYPACLSHDKAYSIIKS